ncbi:2-nitropropane dioxygenase [Cedecea neteri]|uniref:Nitronate monooxygenase n=1 Tax=Cedecea neteri TaxID=158822 RepID=A0AAN0S7M4_9ENTR|nr:nitronate monooxygenase [Cedecea neteri]AIR62340.1 2-nitropropane dioxygenase [Cedecea neteri]
MFRSLTQLLAIDHPIIQAPMAGVSTPELAAAVSNAGGLGSLGVGASSVGQARAAILKTQALTSRSFSVNLFCHQPAKRDEALERAWIDSLRPIFTEFGGTPPEVLSEIYQSFIGQEAMLEMLLETAPAAVSFHFGVPERDVVEAFRSKGIVTLATATRPEEASLIQASGVDVIVAQGFEAGGHRGMFDDKAHDTQLSIFALVQLLKKQVNLPIVAAGGIMDGAGIHAMLSVGADAVQLGTAFLLCPESAADDGYRQRLKSSRSHRTEMTHAISGRAARSLENDYCRHGRIAGQHAVPAYPVAYDIGKALASLAKSHGHQGYSAHWAGQGVNLIREMPAAELLQTLVREAGL